MSEENSSQNITPAHIKVAVNKSTGLIWLLPLIALLIGVWLVYKSFTEAGIEVLLKFDHDVDIKPHKTEIRFQGVPVAKVAKIDFSSDLSQMHAFVEFDKRAAGLLQKDTQFWIVEPQVTLSKITGLDTLVSGKYINLQIGSETSQLNNPDILNLKPMRFEYEVLDEEPEKPLYMGGLRLTLRVSGETSIVKGAPILFRHITVGSIEKVVLASDNSVELKLYIEEKYKHLITKNTRFWNAGGFKISGNLSNLDIELNTLSSLLIGGVTFSSPGVVSVRDGKPVVEVEDGTIFELYPDRESAFSYETKIRINFASGEGLVKGTQIKYNGIVVGEVDEVDLKPEFDGVIAYAHFKGEAKSVAREGTEFWLVKPKLGITGAKNLETLVAGKYITLKPGPADAPKKLDFDALNEPPSIQDLTSLEDKSLQITLTADRLGSIKEGVKIYYRNVQVGRVDGVDLAENSQRVLIYASIDERFSPLIYSNTKFWNASGVGLDFSLFSGAKIQTESLDALLEGGIALATPEKHRGDKASDGMVFSLNEKHEQVWLDWKPEILLNKIN